MSWIRSLYATSVRLKAISPSYIYTHTHTHTLSISVRRLRERGRMPKSVYVSVVHDLELLRYVLRCAIERQI